MSQVNIDRMLLKRCLDGDGDALSDFDDRGYVRTIRRAVTEVVGSTLSAQKTDDLVNSCIGKVYEGWDTLPLPYRELRDRIRTYVVAIADKYLDERERQQLMKKKP
jgi:hypothetical protein